MQIYKEMNIGTAKPTSFEVKDIKHHLIDFVSPDTEYNVSKYKEDANKKIEEILSKGKVPIIVGGTGLYIDTLINGIEFADIKHDEKYVKELEEEYEKYGADYLFNKLEKVDKESSEKIDKNNIRRVIRALEIYKVTGKTKSLLDKESKKEVLYNFLVFGIKWDREKLYERINKRVDIMIEEGLLEEVKNLNSKYKISKTALQGLGYKEVIEYLDGKITYEEMIEKIKMESRRYAKRQVTWFNHIDNIIWLDGENKEEMINEIMQEVHLNEQAK